MFFRQYILEGNFKQPVPIQPQPQPQQPPVQEVPVEEQPPIDDAQMAPEEVVDDSGEMDGEEVSDEMDDGSGEDMDGTEEDLPEEEPDQEPYLVPLKKFFLIQKLMSVKSKLDENRMGMVELDNILKFVNELPYETLLLLSDRVIDLVKEHIKEVKNDKNKTNKSKI